MIVNNRMSMQISGARPLQFFEHGFVWVNPPYNGNTTRRYHKALAKNYIGSGVLEPNVVVYR
jgi:hypothetical protein